MSAESRKRSVGLFAYPWDILDRGIESFADCCQDLGVTELHVTTCYHSGKFLLPRNSQSRVYFPEPGRLYFQPQAFDCKIQPLVSGLASTRWLEDLAAASSRRGLEVAAWTVFFHSSELGARYPQLTTRNLFGDTYPFALCPSNAEVQDYAAALCRTLKALGLFHAIDLETIGYLGYFHGYHHEVTAVPAGPLENFILSLCFCDACRAVTERLGVDLGRLRTSLQNVLLRSMNADDASTTRPDNAEQVATLVVQSPDLQQLLRMRFDMIRHLVTRLKSEAGETRLSVCTSSFVGAPSNIWMEGIHLSELSPLVDSYLLLGYSPDPNRVNSDLVFCLSSVASPEKLKLTLNLGLPITPSLANAAAKVEYALKLGITKFAFFNFGFLGEGRLAWVRNLSRLIREFPGEG